jgi:hypothetical protein
MVFTCGSLPLGCAENKMHWQSTDVYYVFKAEGYALADELIVPKLATHSRYTESNKRPGIFFETIDMQYTG